MRSGGGRGDECGSPDRPSDKTLKLYDGYVHDLLNDVGKETVMADIKGWIGARLAMPMKEAVR